MPLRLADFGALALTDTGCSAGRAALAALAALATPPSRHFAAPGTGSSDLAGRHIRSEMERRAGGAMASIGSAPFAGVGTCYTQRTAHRATAASIAPGGRHAKRHVRKKNTDRLRRAPSRHRKGLCPAKYRTSWSCLMRLAVEDKNIHALRDGLCRHNRRPLSDGNADASARHSVRRSGSQARLAFVWARGAAFCACHSMKHQVKSSSFDRPSA